MGRFEPEADGQTFHVGAAYTDTLRSQFCNDHAKGRPVINRICGPVEKVNDTTYTIRFYRMGLNNPKRTGDIWLIAENKGDEKYKSTVQQFNIRIPFRNAEVKDQKITFDPISDIPRKTGSVQLNDNSDSGMLVYYYVQEGPAEIEGNTIHMTKIPKRSKYPVKVIVVAWQYGRSIEPKVKTAEPVVRSFYITK